MDGIITWTEGELTYKLMSASWDDDKCEDGYALVGIDSGNVRRLHAVIHADDPSNTSEEDREAVRYAITLSTLATQEQIRSLAPDLDSLLAVE